MKKVKIVCTIGPSCSDYNVLRALVDAGMNVARLNFSHGSHETHAQVVSHLKSIREETGKNIGILQDLSGPKIRVGVFPDGRINLQNDSLLRLVSSGSHELKDGIHTIPVSYENLVKDAQEGGTILLDDGYITLRVEKKEEEALLCRVVDGGILKNRKGVNFPGLVLSGELPTKKDIEDLRFGVEQGVDFVALSFVQKKDDIIRLREEMEKAGGDAAIIAKIERDTALRELDGIVKASDGIMVARGDLGIECDLSMIPIYQKMIVRLCNLNAKPVITATQMLESMISNSLPTRAEVTDVANAIYDGSDAIMLSAETAVGAHPVQTVRMMRRIAGNVEKNLWLDRGWVRDERPDFTNDPELAIAESICTSAGELDAKYIIANTMSGKTAHLVSMFRPRTPILALTPEKRTYYRLSLVWGVDAVHASELKTDFLDMIEKDQELLKEKGFVEKGDLVVVSAGIPHSRPGQTNIMKLHRIE